MSSNSQRLSASSSERTGEHKQQNHTITADHKKSHSSLHAHLLHKAQQCEDAREHMIARAADASGNEVFKYMLLLNCLECQSYVTEIQLQAHQSFRWSTYAGIAGFLLVSISIVAAFTAHMLDKKVVEVTLLSALAGVITTSISSIFFYLYNRTLKRMDNFHTQLRDTQKLIVSLFLSGLDEQDDHQHQRTNEIIHFLLLTQPQDQTERQNSIQVPTLLSTSE